VIGDAAGCLMIRINCGNSKSKPLVGILLGIQMDWELMDYGAAQLE